MKKAIAIATALTIAIIISCACALPAVAETHDTYEMTTVIVGIEPRPDTIRLICLDEQGDLWEFFDEDEWWVGDVVVLTMFAHDEDRTHDEVIDTKYIKSLELHELAYYILEATGM